MTKRMLIDATHAEETRVATINGTRLEDLDFEVATRKMLKGNIYLAKITRIEPSLQAAFVEYGGNRHGFLAFSEIHPDYYRIPVGDRPEDEISDEAVAADSAPFAMAARQDFFTPDDTTTQPYSPATAAAAWAVGEPGSGTVADLIPSFAPESNSSLVRDFALPAIPESSAFLTPTLDADDSHNNTNGALFAADAAASEDGLLDQPPAPDAIGGEVADNAPEQFVRPRRPNYKIQEVIQRRQVLLIQVVKEERGNKGAALTTYLSLAGRYCVLMPNTAHGGGVSRKITNHQDRRRMKEILDQLDIPEGMALILRTAGMEQEIADIKRDLDYLLRLWNSIREQTLQSTAPAVIYEEADLIKRALRDLYSKEVSEILVAGRGGYERARAFMNMLIPDAVDQIKPYEDHHVPLFFRYQVEEQIDALHSPIVQLRSGGYIVINPTEALISIDVNSGRATRERHIEETALKTNLEAAEEIGRQLRLRDFAGLVVIDFIDMEDNRHNAAVERRLKDAMRGDRARLQIGRISHFGLLELSRQRLRPSLLETNFEKCSHCEGTGYVRSVESTALAVLRAVEQEGVKHRGGHYLVKLPSKVAFYIFNNKRTMLSEIQQRYGMVVQFEDAPANASAAYSIERVKARAADDANDSALHLADIMSEDGEPPITYRAPAIAAEARPEQSRRERPRRERGGQERGNRSPRPQRDFLPPPQPVSATINMADVSGEGDETTIPNGATATDMNNERPRRRGRRGGRRRGRGGEGEIRVRQNNETDMTSEPAVSQAMVVNGAALTDNTYAPSPSENGHNHAATSHSHSAPNYAAPRPPRVEIPRSIHELDTTPREDNRPVTSSPYEVINQAGDKPKGGWWRRLTGQE